ncbi:MAG: Asp-tRNA(Asn)/Glu-tRNA(Gln) amidotransferase subunit GatB [bacterium]
MSQTYETIIGLEIHVQLKTKSKLFCGCDNTGEEQPINTTICPVCTGQPGVLPVPNQQAIDWAVMAAMALDCRIPEFSKFDRKSYFYPDLPKGYQISQFDEPIGVDGRLTIQLGEHTHRVGITRLHLEEDAAKLLHPEGKDYSIVDFNRAGTPLAEIVTEPDIRSPEEARVFLQELRLLTRHLGISDADMEKGHLRCDANISLRPAGEVTLSPKTEIKNLNSFRSVEHALAYEEKRQKELWDAGTPESAQSTRGWDERGGETVLQRTKEESSDYRYFPEPDLPPLNFTNEYLRDIRARIPELPFERRRRFAEQYGCRSADGEVFVHDRALGDYSEEVFSELKAWALAKGVPWDSDGKSLTQQAVNWLINRFQTILVAEKLTIAESRITPENFAEFITIIDGGNVTNQAAQKLLEEMQRTGGDPSDLIEQLGLQQIDDADALRRIVLKVIDENPKVVQDYRNGKEIALKFLVGRVMAETRGKGNPQLIHTLLVEQLTAGR